MEPATLYILFQLASGSDRVLTLYPDSMDRCEEIYKRTPKWSDAHKARIIKYACVPRGEWPPAWVVGQPTVGVPLDPKLRP